MRNFYSFIIICIALIGLRSFALSIDESHRLEFSKALAKCNPYKSELKIITNDGNVTKIVQQDILGPEKGVCKIVYREFSEDKTSFANSADVSICSVPVKTLSRLSKEQLNKFDENQNKYCTWE